MSDAAPSLTGQQRRRLRALAHGLKPVVHVGEGGLAPSVIGAIDQALLDHELVKVRLHEPEDKKAMARDMAEKSRSALCGLVGHTVILYRPHPEKPRIVLSPAGG
ncbi:MAG: ribosome assembly RNA-binding protein YhbY [Myxococcota bacterium]|nr:ribosome assembly RNA-binding protein YhbY [Myxococcota bacterium]